MEQWWRRQKTVVRGLIVFAVLGLLAAGYGWSKKAIEDDEPDRVVIVVPED